MEEAAHDPTAPSPSCIAGVVDLYYDDSKDLRLTVKQCEETMEQVVVHDHSAAAAAASFSPGAPQAAAEWTEYRHQSTPYWYNNRTRETVRQKLFT